MSYETREVLAGAYVGKVPNPKSFLTHTVEVEGGRYVRVLCPRVLLDSIADSFANRPGATLPPTCPVCRRRDPRFQEGR